MKYFTKQLESRMLSGQLIQKSRVNKTVQKNYSKSIVLHTFRMKHDESIFKPQPFLFKLSQTCHTV